MKNIVLIPCWRRPEFLAACLKYITLAEGWKDNHYIFTVDSKAHTNGKHDPQVLTVINQFPGSKTVKIRKNRYNGNTYNLLEGYRDAYNLAGDNKAELIFMIETDIFIARDFFKWHKMAHAVTDQFYASACRNQNLKGAQKLPNQPESVYLFPRYQSLGNSFRPDQVKRFLKHANPNYYNDWKGYLTKQFRGMQEFRGMWFEQDGMINRLMVQEGLKGIFPFVPRAYHAGYEGYNRKGNPLPKSLTLTEKTIALMNMTEQEMNERALNPQYKDITMCDLHGHDCDQLKLVNVPASI